MSKRKVWKTIEIVLFIAWCGFILWMTLLSRNPSGNRIFRPNLLYEFAILLSGAETGGRYVGLFIKNILLFIPFGFLLPWKKKMWIVAFIGCSLSILVEAIQYITTLGEFEIDDVIANTIGAVVGFGLFKLAKICFKSHQSKDK